MTPADQDDPELQLLIDAFARLLLAEARREQEQRATQEREMESEADTQE